MAWTYTDPMTVTKDQVRVLIPDIDETNQLVQDETINFYLTLFPNVFRCAAHICKFLAGQGSTEPDFSLGGKIAQQSSQTPAMWRKHARELENEANIRGLTPFAGGYHWSERPDPDDDSDIIPYPIRQEEFTEPFTEEPLDQQDPLSARF